MSASNGGDVSGTPSVPVSQRLAALNSLIRNPPSVKMGREAGETVLASLTELVAVVDAVERHYDEWVRINPPDLLPLPLQEIGTCLTELRQALAEARR